MTTTISNRKSSLPPLADGEFILGSARAMLANPIGFLTQQYLKHGSVFRIKAATQSLTVIAGAQANQFVTKEGMNHFRSWEVWHPQEAEFGAKRSMISLDGADHAQMRKIQKRAYARSAVDGRYNDILEIVQTEVNTWQSGQPVSVTAAMKRIVTEQLGQLTTNTSPREYIPDLLKMVRTMLFVYVTKQYPKIMLLDPKYQRSKARITGFVREMVQAHRDTPTETRAPDLIDDLIQAQQDDPKFIPEEDLLFAAMGPYIAGLDTAANALSFILYTLHQHPEVLEQVKAEVDTAFSSGELTAESIRSMDVLHRVILETLRLYPIAPALTRTVSKTFEFGGFTILEGTSVLIGTTVPHFLPEHYKNPHSFDIERFAPPRAEHRRPGVYVPFGVGSHTCLGAGMAEAIIMVSVAGIIRGAKLEADPKYKLKIISTPTPSPDDKFALKFLGKQ
jgi:cytochrome P450